MTRSSRWSSRTGRGEPCFPVPMRRTALARSRPRSRTLAGLAESDRAGSQRSWSRDFPPGSGGGVSSGSVRDRPARGPLGGRRRDLPALAVALQRSDRKAPAANLLPDDLRPRPFPWPLVVTAALALITLAVGAAIPTVSFVRERRALAALDNRVARLAPEVQRAERRLADVERARRELTTLRDFEAQGLHPLPVLRELTDTIPGDAWLTNLSVDRDGLELGGFADAASQLIPLLEASPASSGSSSRRRSRRAGTGTVPAPSGVGAARRRALMPALRRRERSLLILAGLIAVGVAAYVYVVEPLIEAHTSTRELVVARRGLLTRQERLVARAEAYGKELTELRAEIDRRRRRLLTGDKTPLAASELQKLVKTPLRKPASRCAASGSCTPVERGGYTEVPVEMTLAARCAA